MELFSWSNVIFLGICCSYFCVLNVTAVVNVIFSIKKKKRNVKQSNFHSTLAGDITWENPTYRNYFKNEEAHIIVRVNKRLLNFFPLLVIERFGISSHNFNFVAFSIAVKPPNLRMFNWKTDSLLPTLQILT